MRYEKIRKKIAENLFILVFTIILINIINISKVNASTSLYLTKTNTEVKNMSFITIEDGGALFYDSIELTVRYIEQYEYNISTKKGKMYERTFLVSAIPITEYNPPELTLIYPYHKNINSGEKKEFNWERIPTISAIGSRGGGYENKTQVTYTLEQSKYQRGKWMVMCYVSGAIVPTQILSGELNLSFK